MRLRLLSHILRWTLKQQLERLSFQGRSCLAAHPSPSLIPSISLPFSLSSLHSLNQEPVFGSSFTTGTTQMCLQTHKKRSRREKKKQEDAEKKQHISEGKNVQSWESRSIGWDVVCRKERRSSIIWYQQSYKHHQVYNLTTILPSITFSYTMFDSIQFMSKYAVHFHSSSSFLLPK